jgi:PAS domain-containing protein
MFESRIYRIEQFFLAEWFAQKGHRAGFEGALARIVIRVRRNEDDRDLPVGRNRLPLKIESVHTGHSHIENQARRIVRLIRIPKRLRRRETLRPKSDRLDQIVEGVPESVIIIDDRNERDSGHAASTLLVGLSSEKRRIFRGAINRCIPAKEKSSIRKP